MASELAGRVPPHNREAEKAVLGAVMIDQEAVSAALEFLRSDDFYVRAHGIIFSAVEYISNRGDVIDLITLTDEIKHRNVLDACGGLSYIASLTSDVPTTANIQYYARIVRNLSIRRRLLRISNDLISKSYDESEDTQEIVADAEKLIFDISDESAVTGKYRSSSQIVNETVNSIEKLYHAGGSYTGVPSGFVDLDDHTSGFQNSEFIVIGARPSVGKTGRLYEAPLFIEDTPNIKLLDLRSQARRMKKNEGVKIIFIDYIGLIESESKRNIPRHEQVAEISRSLKALARELDIPVVCLSQVGRQSEGKEPTLQIYGSPVQ
jgi:replicative DNA helicase